MWFMLHFSGTSQEKAKTKKRNSDQPQTKKMAITSTIPQEGSWWHLGRGTQRSGKFSWGRDGDPEAWFAVSS